MEQTTKPAVKAKGHTPRGRPKADEPGVSLTAWVPQHTYDRLCRLARQRDQSVSAVVKSLLILRLE